MRLASLAAIIPLLAACAADLPPDVPQGEVAFGGQTYPVTSRGDLWFVGKGEDRVQCRAPTSDDCYWSLRAHLLARATPDELG